LKAVFPLAKLDIQSRTAFNRKRRTNNNLSGGSLMAQDELTTGEKAVVEAVERFLRQRWSLHIDSESTEEIMDVINTLSAEANSANLSDAQLGYLVRLLARPDRYRNK
jgi:hypothetical protein